MTEDSSAVVIQSAPPAAVEPSQELPLLPREQALLRKQQLDEVVERGDRPAYGSESYAKYRKYRDQIYNSLALQQNNAGEDARDFAEAAEEGPRGGEDTSGNGGGQGNDEDLKNQEGEEAEEEEKEQEGDDEDAKNQQEQENKESEEAEEDEKEQEKEPEGQEDAQGKKKDLTQGSLEEQDQDEKEKEKDKEKEKRKNLERSRMLQEEAIQRQNKRREEYEKEVAAMERQEKKAKEREQYLQQQLAADDEKAPEDIKVKEELIEEVEPLQCLQDLRMCTSCRTQSYIRQGLCINFYCPPSWSQIGAARR